MRPSGDAVRAYSRLGAQYEADRHANRLLARARAQSLRRLLSVLPSGQLLEIGAGTGEEADAVADGLDASVLAVEPAAGLARLARQRPSARAGRVQVASETAAHALQRLEAEGRSFDGAWSSFALAYDRLENLGPALATVLRSGAPLVISLPNRWVLAAPWRIVARWRGRFRHRVGGVKVRVHAYSVRQVVRVLRPWFVLESIEAFGVCVPPGRFWKAWRRSGPVARALERLDAALAPRWPWRHLGDHTLYVLRRLPPDQDRPADDQRRTRPLAC